MFEDYDDEALCKILMKKCKKDGVKIDQSVAQFAVSKLAKARASPNFGNAGEVNNLLTQAKLKLQRRLALLPKDARDDRYMNEDFGDEIDASENTKDIFSGLVGCDSIIAKLEEYKDTIELCSSSS